MRQRVIVQVVFKVTMRYKDKSACASIRVSASVGVSASVTSRASERVNASVGVRVSATVRASGWYYRVGY
mgnify:CR=1 FL=1